MSNEVDFGEHAPYQAAWEQPCHGRMIVADQSGPVWMVSCEKCDWTFGFPAHKADPAFHRQMAEQRAGFPARFTSKPYVRDEQNAFAHRAACEWADALTRGELGQAFPAPAFHGDSGTGKSHLLVELGTVLIRDRGCSVLFRSSARMLDELQDRFDDEDEQQRYWQQLLTVEVLLLDDVGAERGTEWRVDRLARLVDERYERELPIVAATNYPPDRWEQVLDERTRSRLRGMTFPVALAGADRRFTTDEGELQ